MLLLYLVEPTCQTLVLPTLIYINTCRRKISVKLSIILVKISSTTTPEIWFYYGERNNKFPWSNLIWVIRWYTSTAEWIVQSMSDTLLRTDILSYYTGLEVFSRLDWKYLRPINEAIWTVSHRSNKWTNFNVNLSSTLFISRNWRKKTNDDLNWKFCKCDMSINVTRNKLILT